MMRSSIGLAICLTVLSLQGCGDKNDGAGSASAAPAKTSAAPSAPPPVVSSSPPPPPAPTSLADAFPATPLPGKKFEAYTVNLPKDGKLTTGGIKAVLDTPDYKLQIGEAGKATIETMKTMVSKMKTFKSFVVDEPDGILVEMDEKGKPQFLLTRMVKVGDATLMCENTLTKPPKDKGKAQEAYDVCGSLKKK